MAKYVRVEADTARKWMVEIGIPALVVAIGFAMTGYINFWVGIAIMTIAVVAIFADFCVRNSHRSKRQRIGGSVAIIAMYLILLWFVFVAAPLEVLFSAPPSAFPSGTRVYGLQWKDGEFPVNVTVSNDTDVSYENFDSYYRIDSTLISRVGVYSGINTCVASPENQAVRVSQGVLSTQDYSIPMFLADQQNPASVYRVRCDKIAPHSHIDLIIAAAVQTKPNWIIGSFRYDAINRHRGPLFFSKCLVDRCPDVPTQFVGG